MIDDVKLADGDGGGLLPTALGDSRELRVNVDDGDALVESDAVRSVLALPEKCAEVDFDATGLTVDVQIVERLGDAVRLEANDGVRGMHALSVTAPLVPEPPLAVLRPTNDTAVKVTSPVLA